MKVIKRCFVGVFCSLIMMPALASIAVEPMILNFIQGNPPAQNVMILNGGKKTAYVDITPYVVEHPGTKAEKRLRVYDPSKSGVLVVPNKLIMAPGQQRYVRIMLTKPLGRTDRIYRVTFIPKIAGMTLSKKVHGRALGLHLIVGYGILVIARPQNPVPDLQFTHHNHLLTLFNDGNTNIFILGGKQCFHNKCFKIPGHRLYTHNKWSVKLPYTSELTLKTEWLEKYKTYHIK